jgi:hypothetical protein
MKDVVSLQVMLYDWIVFIAYLNQGKCCHEDD